LCGILEVRRFTGVTESREDPLLRVKIGAREANVMEL
jgi:hypothetical protein